jgi:hypothetical protein
MAPANGRCLFGEREYVVMPFCGCVWMGPVQDFNQRCYRIIFPLGI